MSSRKDPPASRDVPAAIGPYRIVEVLGEGGMGTVFLAEQSEPIERRVALKVVKLGMDTAEVLARFEAEQRALSRMDHPGIASILDAGSSPDGRPYFVMELVPGLPITEFCDRERLDLEARLELLSRVCRAVHHTHERGVVHRDLKPNNVLVRLVDGVPQPKVIDFGIAKATGPRLTEQTLHTEEGRILGTPSYMSPEQADPRRQDVDQRADVFSLGTIAYELLVGVPPIDEETLRSKSFVEVQRMIAEDVLPTPSERLTRNGERAVEACERRRTSLRELRRRLRDGLDDVVLKAVEKRPELRYPSAAELADDLERCARRETPNARRWGVLGVVPRRLRRHRRTLLAASGAALVLALVTTLAVLYLMAAAERDALLQELGRLEEDTGTKLALEALPRDAGALRAPDILENRGVPAPPNVAVVLPKLERRAQVTEEIHGKAAQETIQALADQAAALIVSGHTREGERVLADVLRRVETNSAIPGVVTVRLQNDHALALQALGEVDRARTAFEKIRAEVDAKGAMDPELAQVIVRNCESAAVARPPATDDTGR